MKVVSRRMNMEDIPCVVDNMKMEKILLVDFISEFFYNINSEDMFQYNFERMKASILAIEALHADTLDILCNLEVI